MQVGTAPAEPSSNQQEGIGALVTMSGSCAGAGVLLGFLMLYIFFLLDGGIPLSVVPLLEFVWSFLSVPVFAAATRRAARERYGWAAAFLAIGTILFFAQAIGAVLIGFDAGLADGRSGGQCYDGGYGGACDAYGPSGFASVAYFGCTALGVIAFILAVVMRVRRNRAMKSAAPQETEATQTRS